jgi:hypothetical protein
VVVPRQLAERRLRRLPAAAGGRRPARGRPCACVQAAVMHVVVGVVVGAGTPDAMRVAYLALRADYWRCTHGAPLPSSAFFLLFHSLPGILDCCSSFVQVVFLDFFSFVVSISTLLRVPRSARAQGGCRVRQMRSTSCHPPSFARRSATDRNAASLPGYLYPSPKPQAADRFLAVPASPDSPNSYWARAAATPSQRTDTRHGTVAPT